VGVAGDVHYRLDADPPWVMYQLYSQVSDAGMQLVNQLLPARIAIRTKPGVTPLSVSRAAQNALLKGDPQLPATQVQTMDQIILRSTAQANFALFLLGVFAAIGLSLAALGIYGVLSYGVEQRNHEIGVRMALGAQLGDVLRTVVGPGMILVLMGIGMGIIGALGLTRFLSSLLYGVKPTDPLTFVIVSIVLCFVALAACYIPARRATKVDPMVALRYE
jgi:putative ABC transport system permease protein